MFITWFSTTCFGAMAIFRLMIFNRNIHKHSHMACVFFIWRMGAGLLNGGKRARVCCREGVYTGVYYANLSIVQFRAMMLGIHVYDTLIVWLWIYSG